MYSRYSIACLLTLRDNTYFHVYSDRYGLQIIPIAPATYQPPGQGYILIIEYRYSQIDYLV